MGAILVALLDIFRWLAGTVSTFYVWIASTVRAVASWAVSLFQWVFAHLWNLGVDFLQWLLNGIFWLLGNLLVLPLKLVELLVNLLPDISPDFSVSLSPIVPAFNIANQILPISEAISLAAVWASFYGLMALWRAITFIRGGR